jgi:large subunit ribosomal protein L25
MARSTKGKGAARSLRRDGRLPAIIYGHAREPLSLSVPERDFERLLEKFAAENTVIELSIDGSMSRTLIREIQRHPVKRNVLHVDFQELVAGERMVVRIPIVLTGTAKASELGGILEPDHAGARVPGRPLNMPGTSRRRTASRSALDPRQRDHDPGGRGARRPECTVCIVAAPKEEEPRPLVCPEAAAEPELIRKPKEGEEGEPEET